MATSTIPTMLRLPSNIHEKIKKLAVLERRSMNMQIEHALEKYISDYEKTNGSIVIDNQDIYQ